MSDAPDRIEWDLPSEIEFILGRIPAALCYIDREQRYRYVNASFSSWTGRTPESSLGRTIQEVVGLDHYRTIEPHIERVLSGVPARYELEVPAQARGSRWLRGVMVPDLDPAGQVRGYLLMVEDITQRKRAELALEAERLRYEEQLEREVEERTQELKALQSKLLHAGRLSAAEEMAGSVAHAVNNPLQALLGTVEMARQHMIDKDVALARVHQLAQRVESVVRGTLRLVRSGHMELETHSCRALCDRLMAELEPRARHAQIELVWKIGTGLPRLSADPTLFVAAITGIVENALHVTPPGGQVCIEVASVRSGSVVRFCVADEGPGIPEALRSRIIEPFFTTRGGGTGLGLSIAHGIVQGHKGKLRFDSRPGGGTLVTVELPAEGSFSSNP